MLWQMELFSSFKLFIVSVEVQLILLCSFVSYYFDEFISSTGFCGIFLVDSMYKITSSANRGTYTFSFPVWIPVIHFSCLIALTRTSTVEFMGRNQSFLSYSLS